jgi:hypothetical protein
VTLPTGQARRDSVSTVNDGSISLDLRIAVTGHRKLTATPALRTAIDQALDRILDQFRPAIRDRCRLVVVSALADGADRIVADRVLARPGARLEVILPMNEADYVTDFDRAHSLPEFHHLLGEASWVATMPPSPTRQDAYLDAGRAVIDRADATIAIWDGYPAAGKGGTGDIVGYLREEHRPWIWLPMDGGQPAAENLDKLSAVAWLSMKDPDLARFCEFNDTGLDGRRFAATMNNFRQGMIDPGGADLAADVSMLLSWLQAPLTRAELLSKRFQSLYLRLSAMLFAFAAAAVCIVGAQLVFVPHIRFVVAGEIACLVSILVGLEWGRRTHIQQRWLSARYLAERLRSAFFLALIGAEEQSSATAVLSGDVPVAPWVGIAFEMLWIRRPQLDVDRASVKSLRDFLSRAWIDDQRSYFTTASERAERNYRFSTRAVEALFAVSLIVAILHVALPGPEDWGKQVVSLLAIGIPAGAAALVGYSSQREYHRNSLRYGRMADSLTEADELMLAAADHAKVREIAATVDRMLRQERGEWFGTVALHDLEVPA